MAEFPRRLDGILSPPIPMLDGKSPKQAVRSKAERQKVVVW
jgi:hypothetical protein